MRDKIISAAESLFVQYGVRSVSMDDVARVGSFSKKTIYQHFSNKDELVVEVARQYMERNKEKFLAIGKEAGNTIEELFLISKYMRENILEMNPSLLYDLEKYHPNAFEVFRKYKNEFIKGQVTKNIERGKKEGYFRKELNAKILSMIRVEQIQMIFNERIFPKSDYDFGEVQMQVFDHFVHGLLTEEGRTLYYKYLSKETKPILK